MNDESNSDVELIDRLRSALDELTEGIDGSSQVPTLPISLHPTRRRRLLPAIAAAAVACVVAAGVVRSQQEPSRTVRSPGTATVDVTVPLSPSTDPPATVDASVVPPTLPPPTNVASGTTLNAVGAISVLALGESVMQGAAAAMAGRGIVVDALENRGPKGMLEVAEAYVATQRFDAVVIQIGTNGTVSEEEYDAIMTALADIPRVIVMTVKAPKDWIAGNNAIIRNLPSKFANVTVLDWEGEALKIPDELSQADGGVHLNSSDAVDFYTDLVLQAVGS